MIGLALSLLLSNAVTLSATDEILEVTTTTAASTDFVVSYLDKNSSTYTPGTQTGNIASATTTTVLAAPAASTQRAVVSVRLVNAGSIAQTVQLKFDKAATERRLTPIVTLAAGEALELTNDGRMGVFMANGSQKITADRPGFGGLTLNFMKTATAVDAAGYRYAFPKDNGMPGAYTLGTPGLNGVNGVCDVVGTSGSGGALSLGTWLLPDASSGAWYLTKFGLNAIALGSYDLIDVLWYNTGLVVTTTTAQTVTMGALPARDINGSTNGEGVMAALLTTTANTNAAAIANTTLSYTNSAGTAGRTGTFFAGVGFQAPATPVIGTWMPFQLQAGDTGIRSVQSVTLGTSYAAGALTLVLYVPRDTTGVNVAHGPSGGLTAQAAPMAQNPGVRVYDDSCFWIVTAGMPATTAPTISGGVVQLIQR